MNIKTKITKLSNGLQKGLSIQLEIEKNYIINYVNNHLILFLNKNIQIIEIY